MTTLANKVRSIEALLVDYETSLLKARLRALPKEIRAAKLVVSERRAALRDLELGRAELEAEILLEVTAATDEKGKPRYSNAELRSAAVVLSQAGHTGYQTAGKVIRTAEMDLAEAQGQYEELQDEYRSYRYIVRLTAAELSLLADIEEDEEYLAEGRGGERSQPF